MYVSRIFLDYSIALDRFRLNTWKVLKMPLYGYLYLVLGVVALVNAGESVIISTRTCDKVFNLDDVEYVDVRYNGQSIGGSECALEFLMDDTSNYYICVQPVSLGLDCRTRFEFQKYFIARYSNDGELTCGMNYLSTYDETCEDYVTQYYVVLKKDDQSETVENSHIRVYKKQQSIFKFRSGSWFLWLVVVVVILVIVGLFVFCCILQQRRRRESENARVNYSTALGTTVVQTGVPNQYYGNTSVPPNQQALIPQQGIQQPMAPVNQYSGQPNMAGFTVHPMVSQTMPYNYQPVQQ